MKNSPLFKQSSVFIQADKNVLQVGITPDFQYRESVVILFAGILGLGRFLIAVCSALPVNLQVYIVEKLANVVKSRKLGIILVIVAYFLKHSLVDFGIQ